MYCKIKRIRPSPRTAGFHNRKRFRPSRGKDLIEKTRLPLRNYASLNSFFRLHSTFEHNDDSFIFQYTDTFDKSANHNIIILLEYCHLSAMDILSCFISFRNSSRQRIKSTGSREFRFSTNIRFVI